MDPPSLDSLMLTQAELSIAKEQVRQMAYFKWKNAGCPDGRSQRFWSEAELEWIEYFYVPHRDSTDPQTHSESRECC